MTPQTLISRLDAAIAGYGQTVVLRRTQVDSATGGITVALEITCPAAVRNFGPQDLVAGEVQDIQVVISPTALGGSLPAVTTSSGAPVLTADGNPISSGNAVPSFGVPLRDDRILIDDNPSNIVQIAPLYYGATLCRVNLLCRG